MTELLEYTRLLAHYGVSLKKLGSNETALLREDALGAIDLLDHTGIAVLGGHVYFKTQRRVETAQANWQIERRTGEENESYARRSCVLAREYIAAFPEEPARTALFVLLIDELFAAR
jgi:Immunity protein 40